MKAKRFTEEQIIAILKEAGAGAKVMDVCRKYSMSDATYYNLKAKHHGMEVNELRRLRQLEDENRKLRHIVADQALNIQTPCDPAELKEPKLSDLFLRVHKKTPFQIFHKVLYRQGAYAEHPRKVSRGCLSDINSYSMDCLHSPGNS